MTDSLKSFRLLVDAFHNPHLRRSERICQSCLRAARFQATRRRNLSSSSSTPHSSRARATSRPWPRPRLNQANAPAVQTYATITSATPQTGPLGEYERRIYHGRLRDDEHQRMLIQGLQDLHETLAEYRPPTVIRPSLESVLPHKESLLGSILHWHKSSANTHSTLPKRLPRGLYMYGDVGSGKTMLMDLFYDTLPANISHKTRIHFHNFMQDVHRRLHKLRSAHGYNIDAVPLVTADIAAESSVLCFDEFQCTDVADAMILRRLIETLMSHGVVIVTTSNRHPTDLYKNGIQRQSFIPCINLLMTQLRIINLASTTDYRKMPRPPGGVYHFPLDKGAQSHADKWFEFLGAFGTDPPHPATQKVWGRDLAVPSTSGTCARFTFQELIGRATGAADYLELMRSYDAFIVTDVPGMTYRERDWARRFITFVDAVYESRAKLVLTTAVPLTQLFLSPEELGSKNSSSTGGTDGRSYHGREVDEHSRVLVDDLGLSLEMLKNSNVFSGDEERFAFARALSRLNEIGTQEWVERGMGLEAKGGKTERESWQRVRSRWREDSL